jgi:hypothetical protein
VHHDFVAWNMTYASRSDNKTEFIFHQSFRTAQGQKFSALCGALAYRSQVCILILMLQLGLIFGTQRKAQQADAQDAEPEDADVR